MSPSPVLQLAKLGTLNITQQSADQVFLLFHYLHTVFKER